MTHNTPYAKKEAIFGLTDRAFLLSHPKFHKKNMEFIITALLENGYPLPFIFKSIHEKLIYLFKKITIQNHPISNDNIDTNVDKKATTFFNIPYVLGVSEHFNRITRDFNSKKFHTRA